MSRKSKKRAAKRAAEAVPEEILAEGSGPSADPLIEADAQALADAASDALSDAPTADVEAEVEAVAMAAEVAVTAAEAARTSSKAKKRGRKPAEPEVALDAWGQPIAVEAAAAEAAPDEPRTGAGDVAEAHRDEGNLEAADHDESTLEAASGTPGAPSDPDASDDETRAAAPDASDTADMAEDELPGEGDEAAADGAVLPTSAAAMDALQLKHLVEALVFAADKPVTVQRLRQLTRVSDTRRIEQALSELAEEYKARGIALQVVSGGYQFRTNTHYSSYVQQLIAGRPVRLSRAQLETLAIVAYRQPITRPEIDEIRGVDSSSTLKVLLERSLIRILGKREEAGRPTLYGTTKEFLDFFSLGDLRELPTLREYSELTAESRKVVSDRLGVSLEGEGTPAEQVVEALADEAAQAEDAAGSEELGASNEQPAPFDELAASDEQSGSDEQSAPADAHVAFAAPAEDLAAPDEPSAPAGVVAVAADPMTTSHDELAAAAGDEELSAADDDAFMDDEAQRAADDAAALAAVQAVDSHATMGPNAPLDPDDLAARLTAGESDHVSLASDAQDDASHAAHHDDDAVAAAPGGTDAADDALHAQDADSEAPDASASDDPPVD